jgi:hypothetical protein
MGFVFKEFLHLVSPIKTSSALSFLPSPLRCWLLSTFLGQRRHNRQAGRLHSFEHLTRMATTGKGSRPAARVSFPGWIIIITTTITALFKYKTVCNVKEQE